jgi:hypothetical protein
MMKHFTFLLLLLSFGFAFPAPASPEPHRYTGGDLLTDCSSSEPTRYMRCLTFEQGVVEGVQAADAMHGGKPAFFDIPDDVTVGQSVLVVAKYLKEHPEKLHLDASWSIIQALHNAFPVTADSK